METAERINPYKWAQENLSAPRARAFWQQYRELESAKLSDEWRAEWKKCDEIRIAFFRANLEQTNAIERAAGQAVSAIEETIRSLQQQVRDLQNSTRERVSKIQSEVYNLEEYKAQDEKVREIWRRDDEAFQPKAQALMDKYLKAQEASKS